MYLLYFIGEENQAHGHSLSKQTQPVSATVRIKTRSVWLRSAAPARCGMARPALPFHDVYLLV